MTCTENTPIVPYLKTRAKVLPYARKARAATLQHPRSLPPQAPSAPLTSSSALIHSISQSHFLGVLQTPPAPGPGTYR